MAWLKSASQQSIRSRRDLAARIDDTRLNFASGTDIPETIRALCVSAMQEQFRAVCVPPAYVALAKSLLTHTEIKVAAVIGFPKVKVPLQDELRQPTFGNIPWDEKVREMQQARADGADEFDVMLNIAEFLTRFEKTTEPTSQYEVAQLVQGAKDTPIKLIIEADLLDDESIAKAVHMAVNAGIYAVKTSSGMLQGGLGATPENVDLIFRTIRDFSTFPKPLIKASGGITTGKQALALIEAGADIIGTSQGQALLNTAGLAD